LRTGRRRQACGHHGACQQQGKTAHGRKSWGHYILTFTADTPPSPIWPAEYLPPMWRHKVNPATPEEINAGCDKKVA
jgi:hypothetical protein